jgi:hypothetical protein
MRRRRRSASLLPPLPSPTDVPEDADGRVAILAIAAPPERFAPAAAPTPPAPVAAPSPPPAADSLQAWLPVAALGVAMLVTFIVGVLVTR